MQKARRHLSLRPLVSAWFQVLFTLLLAVLFTFPSRYLCAIGLSGVFSLTRWYWQIHTKFLWFRATQDTTTSNQIHIRGYHPLWPGFPSGSISLLNSLCSPSTPYQLLNMVWALPRSLATTYGIIFLFSPPPGTQMFQFPRFYLFRVSRLHLDELPHSDIYDYNGYLHLIVAFRSLSRPSSSLRAQAFPIRSYSLSYIIKL